MKDINKLRVLFSLMVLFIGLGMACVLMFFIDIDTMLDSEDHGASHFGLLCASNLMMFFWLMTIIAVADYIAKKMKMLACRYRGRPFEEEENEPFALFILMAGLCILLGIVYSAYVDPLMFGEDRTSIQVNSLVPFIPGLAIMFGTLKLYEKSKERFACASVN